MRTHLGTYLPNFTTAIQDHTNVLTSAENGPAMAGPAGPVSAPTRKLDPFRSTALIAFSMLPSLCVLHTESDRRCGTEKVWLTRLVDVCEILAVPVLIQHTTLLSILLLHNILPLRVAIACV